jgi:hypothetical protein
MWKQGKDESKRMAEDDREGEVEGGKGCRAGGRKEAGREGGRSRAEGGSKAGKREEAGWRWKEARRER